MTRFRCNRCDYQSDNDGDVFDHTKPAEAGGAGHPKCAICRLSLELTEQQTCTRCIGHVRADLRDIADWYALLPATLGHLGSNAPRDSPRHGDGSERLPGGDALVMLAGASARREGAANEGDPRDPPNPPFDLWTWADDWRDLRHEDQDPPLTVTELVRWLRFDRCEWAARWHPDFASFASEISKMHRWLKRPTSKSTAPETREARCINLDCSGADTVKLERGYGDEGRADYWSCPRCHREYTQHGYHLALAATLARQGVVA